MIKSYLKDFIFYFIMLLPASFILFLIISFAIRLYEVSQVDSQEVLKSIKERFVEKYIFDLKFEKSGDKTVYQLGWNNELVPFEADSCDFVIYFFGASSLVATPNRSSFPAQLEQLLRSDNDKKTCVYNFGVGGIDLHVISYRIKSAVKQHKPDLMIIYSGHNDYTNTYHNAILPHYKLFPYDSWHTLPFKVAMIYNRKENNITNDIDARNFLQYVLAPRVETLASQFLIQAGLLNISKDEVASYNEEILSFFKRNVESVNNFARSLKIPLLWVTPISNYHAEPFGASEESNAIYQTALNIEDYSERIKLLRKAKDLEFFSDDIRAKTEMLDVIRDISKQNVFVFDLEKKLIEEKYPFDYTRQYDYVHLNEKTHRYFATKIFDFIRQNPKLIHP